MSPGRSGGELRESSHFGSQLLLKMIPFTSALPALRCHVFDLFPAGFVFLLLAYALVIRALFTPAAQSVIDSAANATTYGETLVYNLIETS